MKYNYREGLQKQRSRKWIVAPIVVGLGLLYLVGNLFAPLVYYVIEPADRTAKRLTSEMPSTADRLYIPKINMTTAIVSVSAGESSALEQGAVQRAATSGNPKEGGTYVLTAHRLNLELTPQQTYESSPFYHLVKLTANDDIYIDYKGTRYAYKVIELKRVNGDAEELEAKNDTVQLKLYTVELQRNSSQRDMITAKLVGKVVWTNGQPRLQSL